MPKTGAWETPIVHVWHARREDAAVLAYQFFARAAELQDQGELAPAAAWQTLGRVVCALISAEHETRVRTDMYMLRPVTRKSDAFDTKECRDIASELEQRVERVSRELKILVDAARKWGTLGAGSVQWFANSLSNECNALREQIRRLHTLGVR
jgi:hypothetical protein